MGGWGEDFTWKNATRYQKIHQRFKQRAIAPLEFQPDTTLFGEAGTAAQLIPLQLQPSSRQATEFFKPKEYAKCQR